MMNDPDHPKIPADIRFGYVGGNQMLSVGRMNVMALAHGPGLLTTSRLSCKLASQK